MKTKLSARHQLIFDNLIPKQDVWDMCCDHGYVGLAAYKSQNHSNIYFVDQVTSIIQNTKNVFETNIFSSENKTMTHFICKSAQSIEEQVQGTVCIAGVGSYTIYKILDGLSNKQRLKAQRLVLAPQNNSLKLKGLLQNRLPNFEFKSEISFIERTRNRSVLIYEAT